MKREADMAVPFFLNSLELRLLLFGGKGGVGKTVCAAATALKLAKHSPEASFLLVSTDPAHSLADSLAGFLPPPNLKILELDARECLTTFKDEHSQKLQEIASRGTFLDDDDISQLLDLSLPGLDELMAFLEIAHWVEDRSYDCIVVDTAPTGHTMRLLAMPGLIRKWLRALDALLAKHRYLKRLFSGSYRRDEIDSFLEELAVSVKQMETLLRDPVHCSFVPVVLAEVLSIRETSMLVEELERVKVPITDIVINRLYPDNECPVCADGHARQMEALRDLFSGTHLSKYTLWGVPLYLAEVRGLEALDTFWENVIELTEATPVTPSIRIERPLRVEMPAKLPVAEVGATGQSPLLWLFAGKGGVGKTTLACATAVRLAQDFQGKEILLFSTDPAHSLSACLNVHVGPKPTRLGPGLTAMEVDAQAEFQALKMQYLEELDNFLRSILNNLNLTFDREVMKRVLDLSPPGLDEVMALTRVMEFLVQGNYHIFILDSAPTGHLIRFLELPELVSQWLKVFFGLFLKYKHVFQLPKVSQKLVEMSRNLKKLRTLLCDPTQAALYVVSIPTEMAFEETKDLVASCERTGIHIPVLFLNLATPVSECPLCSALYGRESLVRDKFQQTFSNIWHTLIYRQGELRGLRRLGELGRVLYQPLTLEENQ